MIIKKFLKIIVFVCVCLLLISCNENLNNNGGDAVNDNNDIDDDTPVPVETYVLHGLNFSAYTGENQNPNWSTRISREQIKEHLEIIQTYTEWIRTFGSSLGMEHAAELAKELGFKTAIGAWLDKNTATNDTEIDTLIEAAKAGNVDLAIVGSETLYRDDLKITDLLIYIEKFKAEVPDVPVTTGETFDVWLDYPDLVEAVDVLFVNYYPYWVGSDISEAMVYVHNRHQRVLAKAMGKEVLISETGWPSDGEEIGEAVASPENASFYFLNFVSWARAENVKYFYFEAFDEPWKAKYEGPQGANWGIWDKDGQLKAGMLDVFENKTMEDNWTSDCTPGGSGIPEIEFTFVPAKGTNDNLKGQVSHVDTGLYGVAVYIKVGGWWTKPYWSRPVTEISCSGQFTCDVTTGGNDRNATSIIAFLIPTDYDPPSMSGGKTFPQELYDTALDFEQANR